MLPSRLDGKLPYLRLGQAAAQTRTGATWSQAALVTAETAGDQPWTYAAGAITITETGLYDILATITGTLSTFAVRIFRTGSNTVLGQSPTGSGASFTNQAAARRRLTAGDLLVVQVYPSANMNIQADADAAPSNVVLTKLSD
jgi:hypothetical protein